MVISDSEPVLDLEQDRAHHRKLAGMPRIDLHRHSQIAQRRHALNHLRITSEIARLAVGPGNVTSAEYFIYRLYDPSLSLEEKRRFIGKRLNIRCTPAARMPVGRRSPTTSSSSMASCPAWAFRYRSCWLSTTRSVQ